MKNTATKINWKGMECIQLCAGGYTALIAPGIGSNVLRLHDDAHGVEFFRWDENNTPEDIKQSAEVWGLPTLYLPNRFADGVLKTSDATYQLPVNEAAPFHNHIHGFLHKREHTVWHTLPTKRAHGCGLLICTTKATRFFSICPCRSPQSFSLC